MINVQWHKIPDKTKAQIKQIRPLIYLPAPIYIEPERIRQIIDKYTETATLLFGISTEKSIPGMENSKQFKSLTLQEFKDSIIKEQESSNKLALLQHQPEFTKYIIRELNPDFTIFVNGSWQHVLHYQPEYWECVDAKSQIEQISPFVSEDSARTYSKKIDTQNIRALNLQIESLKKVTPESVLDLCEKASRCSWDWNGQTGAAITKGKKLISVGHNKVLPYQAAMLHDGSIREQKHSPIGQALEYYQTNHAEIEAILAANKKRVTLKDADLYTTKFPCPFCARVIASSPIKTIYYSGEYTNNLGYETLKRVGKTLVKI